MAYVHCVSGSGGGADADLMWTNSNPFTSFAAAQTLTMDLTDYDTVIVAFKAGQGSQFTADIANDANHIIVAVPKGTTAYVRCNGSSYNRTFSVSNSGVEFLTAGANTNNIPIKIWAAKLGNWAQ